MTDANVEIIYCVNHPQTATGLRCNKCGKPVCTKCIVRTPVGYRCKDCLRSQQQVFETAVWYDYVLAAIITAPLAGIAGALIINLGFFIIFLAPVAGGLIAELVRWAVRRRRGKYLTWVAAIAFVAGCLPLLGLPLLVGILALFSGEPSGLGFSILGVLWPAFYCVLGASTVYARLRGISV